MLDFLPKGFQGKEGQPRHNTQPHPQSEKDEMQQDQSFERPAGMMMLMTPGHG
jgi:hypothetical protein